MCCWPGGLKVDTERFLVSEEIKTTTQFGEKRESLEGSSQIRAGFRDGANGTRKFQIPLAQVFSCTEMQLLHLPRLSYSPPV